MPYKGGIASLNTQVIFPLTKNLILVGSRLFEEKFIYGRIKRKGVVKKLNRFLTVSAERYIYSSQSYLNNLIGRCKGVAPRTEHIRIPTGSGYYHVIRPTIGEPHKLPKWNEK